MIPAEARSWAEVAAGSVAVAASVVQPSEEEEEEEEEEEVPTLVTMSKASHWKLDHR